MLSVPGVKAPDRRVKYIAVMPDMLIALFQALREPRTYSCTDIPSDAVVCGCSTDFVTGELIVTIESEEFPLLPSGYQMQRIDVSFTEHIEAVALHR